MSFTQEDRNLLQKVLSSVLVPAHSEASIDAILEDASDITQRSTIFFDEHLKVLVCLEIPACSEERLNSYLSNLELRIDAWAVASHDDGPTLSNDGSTTARDLIGSATVTKLDDPFTLIKQGTEDEQLIMQLVWEVTINLGRPRVRIQDPSIIFVPVAVITPPQAAIADDEYLTPFFTSETNILEPLKSVSGKAVQPYLPLSKLEKVLPLPPKKDESITIRHREPELISAHLVVMPRLKYTRIPTLRTTPTTIASLDIDINPVNDIRGTIESIELGLMYGKVTSLMPDYLPASFKSRDGITFLYNLRQSNQIDITTSVPAPANPSASGLMQNTNIDVLKIHIILQVMLPSNSTATLELSWTTNVDFSTPLNPLYGAPAQPMQRTNRPTSLNFAPHLDISKQPQQLNPTTEFGTQPTNRTASTSLQYHNVPTSPPHGGARSIPMSTILSISFTAPNTPAKVGIPFAWKVLIVNNSSKPVKLAIVPLARIQRPTNASQHFAKRHALKASNASVATNSAGESGHSRSESYAKAVVDEHLLYALHHPAQASGVSAVPADTDLVSLTAELRIGPLGVGQCHKTEIRWVAYTNGVLSVDAIRVVDLAREGEGGVGVIHDIRELPEVVVAESDSQIGEESDEESDAED